MAELSLSRAYREPHGGRRADAIQTQKTGRGTQRSEVHLLCWSGGRVRQPCGGWGYDGPPRVPPTDSPTAADDAGVRVRLGLLPRFGGAYY